MNLLAKNMEVILDEGGYDALVGFFSTVPNTRTLSGPLRKAISDGCSRFPDRLIALSMVGDEDVVRSYEESGFLVFEDADRAVLALAALTRFAEILRARARPPAGRGGGAPVGRALVRTCREGSAWQSRNPVPRRASGGGGRGGRRGGGRDRLSGGDEDRLARYRAQDRDRRRARGARRAFGGDGGFCDPDGACGAASPRREDRGRAGGADGEEGRRDHHRASAATPSSAPPSCSVWVAFTWRC